MRGPGSGAFDPGIARSADHTGRIASSAPLDEESIMTYQFTQAADAMAIAEQGYATAAAIKFTGFTSCIGVIAKRGGLLTGAHLVLNAPDGTKFNQNAATRLIYEVLGNQYDKIWIIGCVDIWRTPANGVLAAYEKLTSMIRSLEVVQHYNFADGTYGAQIEDDDIDITF